MSAREHEQVHAHEHTHEHSHGHAHDHEHEHGGNCCVHGMAIKSAENELANHTHDHAPWPTSRGKLNILFGSQTGCAEEVAHRIAGEVR